MSRRYYDLETGKMIGVSHNLGATQYHFTWAMLPLEYIEFRERTKVVIVDNNNKELHLDVFERVIVAMAKSQSYERTLSS